MGSPVAIDRREVTAGASTKPVRLMIGDHPDRTTGPQPAPARL
jgi:hypothetical protein